MGIALSIIRMVLPTVVFAIFYSIAAKKTKKYIEDKKIPDGKTLKTALRLTFLTYYLTVLLAAFQTTTGEIYWLYIMLVVYGLLGTVAHVFTSGHRRMNGKNDVTTILYGFTFVCWQVMQWIILVVTAVVDIIASLIVDDWKQTKKSIQAKEQTEKYFRDVSVDKPVNYQDGLNIEYRKFIETTSVEDNSNARKVFADEYFKKVYSK